MAEVSQTTPRRRTMQPCREGHERCAVDGVECECEAMLLDSEEAQMHLRNGPSPTVCRVMAKFEDRLGNAEGSEQWRKASELPGSEGNA